MKESLDVIAAVIKYNDMSFDEGFGAFDVDGDGLISKHDLSSAAEILQLDLTTEELMAVHKALDVYDDGLVVKAEWTRVLKTSEGDEVLKTLGVQMEHHQSVIGAQGESGGEAKRLFTDQDQNGAASADVAAASSDTGDAGNDNYSDGSFLEGHFANSSPSSPSKQRRGSGGSVEGIQRRDTPLEGEMLLHLKNAEVSRPRQRRPSTADEVSFKLGRLSICVLGFGTLGRQTCEETGFDDVTIDENQPDTDDFVRRCLRRLKRSSSMKIHRRARMSRRLRRKLIVRPGRKLLNLSCCWQRRKSAARVTRQRLKKNSMRRV